MEKDTAISGVVAHFLQILNFLNVSTRRIKSVILSLLFRRQVNKHLALGGTPVSTRRGVSDEGARREAAGLALGGGVSSIKIIFW